MEGDLVQVVKFKMILMKGIGRKYLTFIDLYLTIMLFCSYPSLDGFA
jgi:hypothetical protein